ncbi:MAG: outer membrane protein transport protein [Geminicoccaceae bacterium]
MAGLRRVLRLGFAGSALCLPLAGAEAGSFYLQEQSVTGIGRANAGSVAAAQDASTIYFNPAGMTKLSGPQVLIGGFAINPSGEVKDEGSTAASPGTLGQTIGLTSSAEHPYGLEGVPNFYAAVPVKDHDIWLGLGVTVPFGLQTEYADDFFGRYDSTKSEVRTIDVSPVLAVKVTDWLSIGGGLDIQHASAELKNALPNPLTPGGPSTATDGEFRVQGDDTNVGFNFGILLNPLEGTQIGVHYRSQMDHDLRGSARYSDLTGPLAFLNGTNSADAKLNLPNIVSFGLSQELGHGVTLLGSATWFNWERFREIKIEGDAERGEPTSVQNYDNTWSLAVGTEYRPLPSLTLRTGFQFDQTPTRNEYRTTRIPDGDRYWLSVGASWQATDWFTVDAAYAHIFVVSTTVDQSQTFYEGTALATTVNTRAKTANAGVDVFGLQARFTF